MPHSKKQGVLLSLIMSLVMIYLMAVLNLDVRQGCFAREAWGIALRRLPLGYFVGVVCDLLLCTPLSRRIVERCTAPEDPEKCRVFLLRFCMVIAMTVVMTVFSVLVSGLRGWAGVEDFFTYLPYNFTIALPLQMLLVAPLSLRAARWLARDAG